ncbi:hypothetical protein U9M48_043887 [Paspalum notatum var. saurae]|uniref:Protein ABCI12, chloroplastic n=1 Tax=Paspalum notatum var. saurae TaxID=547442 RepID=A0AAQ3UTQ0_PASNO
MDPHPFPSLTPSPRSLSPEPPAIAAGFELPRRPPPTLPVPPDPTTAFASPVRPSSAHSRRRSRPRPRDRLATPPDRHYRAELKLELAPPSPPPLAPLDLPHRTRLTPAHPTHPSSSPFAHATPRSPPPRHNQTKFELSQARASAIIQTSECQEPGSLGPVSAPQPDYGRAGHPISPRSSVQAAGAAHATAPRRIRWLPPSSSALSTRSPSPSPQRRRRPAGSPYRRNRGQRKRGRRVALLVCSASPPAPAAPSPSDGRDGAAASAAAKWAEWIPRAGAGAGPEKVLRLISGAAATPVCQFVDSPRTFLHSVDPRVKLVWLLALVVLPARSNIYMRFGLVVFLALLSMWVLPNHVWKDQLGRVALLSGFIFIMLGFGADSAPSLVQTRTPPPSVLGIPNIPCSTSGYSYTIMKLGPLQFTRKGLSVASTSASLSFAIFQSASLCLTTTTPEQLASALWWFMIPLKHIGVPVPEIILTLLLSLRFINLVFDEASIYGNRQSNGYTFCFYVRNSALAIVARRINWKKLTAMETIDIFFNYVRRIFKNIFDHAEQISKAMVARGFRGDPSNHKIYFLTESSFGIADLFSLLCLFALMRLASLSDQLV